MANSPGATVCFEECGTPAQDIKMEERTGKYKCIYKYILAPYVELKCVATALMCWGTKLLVNTRGGFLSFGPTRVKGACLINSFYRLKTKSNYRSAAALLSALLLCTTMRLFPTPGKPFLRPRLLVPRFLVYFKVVCLLTLLGAGYIVIPTAIIAAFATFWKECILLGRRGDNLLH